MTPNKMVTSNHWMQLLTGGGKMIFLCFLEFK
jgi:hypothetical protein